MEDLTKYNDTAELLKVLAHPVRLCIVKGLMNQECNVSHMQECLDLPQSTVSQHLSILRSRGIIKGTRKGLEVTYCISNEEVKKIIDLLFD
ncbi:MAG: regulatory protein ArsR [Clostridia bacterium]|jgi:ArsR family transcriptional regulator|nr:regulatory protein ArsR [Clostridia bacterium]